MPSILSSPLPFTPSRVPGCLHADTLVRLTTGDVLSLSTLLLPQALRKRLSGYAVLPDGSVVTAPLKHIRVTQRYATLMRITLSNRKFIDCTPDHQFYLKTKQIVQARDLFLGSHLLTVAPEIDVKVVGQDLLRARTDVYDLDVPNLHNFLLGCGVFVRTG